MIAIAVLVLGYVLWRVARAGFAWDVFFATFARVDPVWLIPSLGLTMLSYLSRSLRWEVMLRPLRRDVPLRDVLAATIVGFTAVILLGRAGEPVRPYLIAAKAQVSFPSQMAAWLIERIFDLLMILILFGYALLTVPAASLRLGPGLQWVFRTGGFVSALICGICLGVLVVFGKFSDVAEERLSQALGVLPERFAEKIRKLTGAFAQGMQSTANSRFLLEMLGYSGVTWAILVAGYYCLFRALPATSQFSLHQVAVFMGLVAFGSAVQIPGIGGGFQVAAILVLKEVFGLRLETATALSVLLWVAAYLPVAPAGVALAFKEGLNWRKIRMIQENAGI